jgi:hypothetical protein
MSVAGGDKTRQRRAELTCRSLAALVLVVVGALRRIVRVRGPRGYGLLLVLVLVDRPLHICKTCVTVTRCAQMSQVSLYQSRGLARLASFSSGGALLILWLCAHV